MEEYGAVAVREQPVKVTAQLFVRHVISSYDGFDRRKLDVPALDDEVAFASVAGSGCATPALVRHPPSGLFKPCAEQFLQKGRDVVLGPAEPAWLEIRPRSATERLPKPTAQSSTPARYPERAQHYANRKAAAASTRADGPHPLCSRQGEGSLQ